MRLMILNILVLVLTSCSPQTRLNRLLNRHPELMKPLTVTIKDTIYIDSIKVDTMVITKPNDTILLEKERLRVRVIRSLDTLRIEGECKSDTIYYEKEVTVNFPEKKENNWLYWLLFLIVFVVLFVGWSRLSD